MVRVEKESNSPPRPWEGRILSLIRCPLPDARSSAYYNEQDLATNRYCTVCILNKLLR